MEAPAPNRSSWKPVSPSKMRAKSTPPLPSSFLEAYTPWAEGRVRRPGPGQSGLGGWDGWGGGGPGRVKRPWPGQPGREGGGRADEQARGGSAGA